MPKTTTKRLSIVDAARLLYRTDVPSDRQIGRIYERMKSGAIRVADAHGDPYDWITTERALADYVAAEMIKRQASASTPASRRRSDAGAIAMSALSSQARDAKQLRGVYHSIWRDAFMAVLLRRRIAHRSVAFQRSVFVAQVVLLGSLVGIVLGVVRLTVRPDAPERVAIECWIDENTDTHQITRWHPTRQAPEGPGVLVEVEYRYTNESRRPVNTRRTFRVAGEKVSELNQD